MKNYLYFLFFLIPSIGISQQEYLHINDPHSWSGRQDGIITNADFEVELTDNNAQIDMFLEFASPAGIFEIDRQLEVIMQFDLPKDSRIIDSWLYMDDYISEGVLINKWKAIEYYESIVNRRQDPSILTKYNNGIYNIKIYPLKQGKTRKIKIRYLSPLTFDNENKYFELPGNILKLSAIDPSFKTTLTVFGNKKPSLVGDSHEFTKVQNGYSINSFDPSEVKVQIPHNNNVRICTYNENGENYYQVYLPGDSKANEGKYTFVLDYSSDHSNSTLDEFLFKVKQVLIEKLNGNASFNIVYSNLSSNALDQWYSGTDENISTAFTKIKLDNIATYSNLANLLVKAINIGKEESVDKIIVISSGGDHGGDAAKSISSQLIQLMGDNIVPISIADFHNKNQQYYYIDNIYYYGNQQLYELLSSKSKGEYFKEKTLKEALSSCFENLSIAYDAFQFNVNVKNGLTYDHYNSTENEILHADNEIVEIGKYFGNSDFEIKFSALKNDVLTTENYIFQPSNITSCHENTVQVFSGFEIQELENQNYDPIIIRKLIDKSMESNVLSKYTAFLCLEKSQSFNDTIIIENNNTTVAVNDIEDPKTLVYPNPFSNEVTIEIILNTDIKKENVLIEIFDTRGKLIDQIDEFDVTNGKIKAVWQSNAQPQIYFCRISTPNQTLTIKLLKT